MDWHDGSCWVKKIITMAKLSWQCFFFFFSHFLFVFWSSRFPSLVFAAKMFHLLHCVAKIIRTVHHWFQDLFQWVFSSFPSFSLLCPWFSSLVPYGFLQFFHGFLHLFYVVFRLFHCFLPCFNGFFIISIFLINACIVSFCSSAFIDFYMVFIFPKFSFIFENTRCANYRL